MNPEQPEWEQDSHLIGGGIPLDFPKVPDTILSLWKDMESRLKDLNKSKII